MLRVKQFILAAKMNQTSNILIKKNPYIYFEQSSYLKEMHAVLPSQENLNIKNRNSNVVDMMA